MVPHARRRAARRFYGSTPEKDETHPEQDYVEPFDGVQYNMYSEVLLEVHALGSIRRLCCGGDPVEAPTQGHEVLLRWPAVVNAARVRRESSPPGYQINIQDNNSAVVVGGIPHLQRWADGMVCALSVLSLLCGAECGGLHTPEVAFPKHNGGRLSPLC